MSEKQVYRLAEVKQLAEDKSKCIMIINNHVYDITRFLDEVWKQRSCFWLSYLFLLQHPGGDEVLKEQHGLDASNAFEDVGHSNDAREQMQQYEIGQLHSVNPLL